MQSKNSGVDRLPGEVPAPVVHPVDELDLLFFQGQLEHLPCGQEMSEQALDRVPELLLGDSGRGPDAGETGIPAFHFHDVRPDDLPPGQDLDGLAGVLGDAVGLAEGVSAPEGDDAEDDLVLAPGFEDALEDVGDGAVPADGHDHPGILAGLSGQFDRLRPVAPEVDVRGRGALFRGLGAVSCS